MPGSIHRLAARVTPELPGVPIAAAVFQPNVAKLVLPGPFGLVAAVVNWRREDRAILGAGGMAPKTLLVVTAGHVSAFDAGLLTWNAVRKIAEWRRADLVARAVPVAAAPPPGWLFSSLRVPTCLRLETSAGELLAELQPVAWNAASKRVFSELRVSTG